MGYYGALMVFLGLSIVVVVCCGAELEVKATDLTTGIDQKKSSTLKDNSIVKPSESKLVPKVDQGKKGKDQNSVSQGGTKNDPVVNNPNKELDSKEAPKGGTNKGDLSKESQGKKGGDKRKEFNDGLDSKKVPKEGTKEGDPAPLKPERKEGVWGEECHSSNKCTDEKNKLIACLRVPGNESPDLSLLIKNQGTSPLTVKILAPAFVQLEEITVQLQEKEDKKLKVSIGKGSSSNPLIVLTAKNGNCSIDFRDLILHNSEKKTDYAAKSTYTNILKKSPSVVYVSIAAVLLIASAFMCVRFWRKRQLKDGSRYQKLETELPVSGGGKTESEVTDGWDNSWGDSWDDEEAPKTPSKPVTPSLSAKGLAPRRLSKEGWKD